VKEWLARQTFKQGARKNAGHADVTFRLAKPLGVEKPVCIAFTRPVSARAGLFRGIVGIDVA
jgi:pyrroloquinoline quinone (PQQ) biosynthesis protein C